MTRFQPWHHRQEITSQDEAQHAVETFRRAASWANVPAPQVGEILFEWFRRGWCIAAVQRAWEITPDNKRQHVGDPDADPLGTLERRLRKWKDKLGTPLDPPIPSMTADQIADVHQRRLDQTRRHGAPASAETRAELIGRAAETAWVKDRRYRVDRVGETRERDERVHAALADLDHLAGKRRTPTSPLEDPPPENTSPFRHVDTNTRGFAKYDQFLIELAHQVNQHGTDSLTPAQLKVLKARQLSIRHIIALTKLID